MKVLVIDDDKMICIALKTIIESEKDMEVCALGYSYDDAVFLFEKHRPDVCLFDIQIGEKNGIDAMKKIKELHSDAKVLFLTTFLDKEYIKDAMNFGSHGYILKDDFENICPAIRSAYTGQVVFGNRVMEKIVNIKDVEEKSSSRNELSPLNEREIEILKYIAEGFNNKEISSTLHLSEGTIRNYISTMLEKLDLRDRTQLAIFYLNSGK